MSLRSAFLSLAALAVFAVPAHAAEEIWAVTTSNNLINFISNNAWVFSSRPITGLAPGEQALAIDYRPAVPVGRLYVLGSTGRIYLVSNPNSGVATAVGAGPFAVLSGTHFGFDFNPTVDRIRLVSDTGMNLRLHPDTGLLAATDGAIAYGAGDPNFGLDADATGAAYTNSVAGAVSTVLYDLDSKQGVLARQTPPNNGTLATVGPVGMAFSGVNGFDISGLSGTAYAAFDMGGTQSTLVTIDLTSGAATPLGLIGCQEPIRGLSVSPFIPTPTRKNSWGGLKSDFRK